MAIDLQMQAQLAVVACENERLGIEQGAFDEVTLENTRLVWFSKTLKNWKAMVITTMPDQLFYEVTHNGENGDTYVDVYQKIHNIVLPVFTIGASDG